MSWEKKPSSTGGSGYNPTNQATLNKLDDSTGQLEYAGTPVIIQTMMGNKGTLDKISDNNGSLYYNNSPVGQTFPNSDTLNLLGQSNGSLTFNGGVVGGGTGGTTTTTSASNLVVGGNVKFKVDFTTQTISWTTYYLTTSSGVSTLNAGSITGQTLLGTNNPYWICYRSGTIEVVSSLTNYTGLVIFAGYQKYIWPLSYSPNQIGVRGGIIFGHRELSIGEWTLIGDSITYDGAFGNVTDHINIPVVTNLGVSGLKMAGSGGMWSKVASVTSTTELCTIMGGTNDQSYYGDTPTGSLQSVGSTFDTNTYYGAYQYTIEGLLNLNPKMVIILATPPRAWTDGTGTTERTGIANYASATKSIAQFYSLPVVDLYNNMGVNKANQATFFQSDGLHPNSYGNERISALMLAQIKASFMSWAV